MSRVFYNCQRCPAYCCSYARICVESEDIHRLAQHFGLSDAAARKRFTKKGHEPGEVVLRHKADDIYGTVCRFLDTETRLCTVYDARPEVCGHYPGTPRCGYYDFVTFERRLQKDPDFIPTTYNV